MLNGACSNAVQNGINLNCLELPVFLEHIHVVGCIAGMEKHVRPPKRCFPGGASQSKLLKSANIFAPEHCS